MQNPVTQLQIIELTNNEIYWHPDVPPNASDDIIAMENTTIR